MKNFSFSLSSTVSTNLQTIELLRRDILATPLSPKTEMKLRFETTVARIHAILLFSGNNPKNKHDIIRELTVSPIKQEDHSPVFALRHTLVYIANEWTVNPRTISFGTLETIAERLGETTRIGTILRNELAHHKEPLKQLLEFLEKSKDHPVTTASLAFLQCMAIAPLGTKTAQFSMMILFLFIHKFGYDLRGLAAVIPGWLADLATFETTMLEAQKSGNFSGFIEFTVQQYAGELEKLNAELSDNQLRLTQPATLFNLTDRQRTILDLLDDPTASITNRAIQKYCKISQITASRELAKLASLGLLYPHGKGRSVYYTKV